jgi:hypothetical protein
MVRINDKSHGKQSKLSRGARIAAAGGAAVAAAGVVAVAGIPAAGAAPLPLPVTLSADGNWSAVFSAQGVPQLEIGSRGTHAQLTVNLREAGHVAPATPPSFTTSNYAAGSPRWVLELANGKTLFGYPQQLGGTASTSFTGAQWEVSGTSTYVTYAAALTAAGSNQVTSAAIVADADQTTGTVDTLTNVQYGGETVSGGWVRISPVPPQTVTAGHAPAPLRIRAATDSSDQALTFNAHGLPDGLRINSATGVIYGTVRTHARSGWATVTATDAYGDHATIRISYRVGQPTPPPPPPPPAAPVLSHGRVLANSATHTVIAWDQTVSSTDDLTINGPGAINGHTGQTTNDQAVYGGLEAGHTYVITIQPTVHGQPAGQPGRITVVTAS